MGMSKLRKQGSVQAVCGPPYVRLYRDPVLEPGTDTGNPGESFTSVGKVREMRSLTMHGLFYKMKEEYM